MSKVGEAWSRYAELHATRQWKCSHCGNEKTVGEFTICQNCLDRLYSKWKDSIKIKTEVKMLEPCIWCGGKSIKMCSHRCSWCGRENSKNIVAGERLCGNCVIAIFTEEKGGEKK